MSGNTALFHVFKLSSQLPAPGTAAQFCKRQPAVNLKGQSLGTNSMAVHCWQGQAGSILYKESINFAQDDIQRGL